MSPVPLPILTLAVKSQRYSCHGCGNCCRDFTVQLREDDIRKLEAQGWEEKLGEPITVTFKGTQYLRQREDGACLFLDEKGLCKIHAEFGFEEKPIACQFFPFSLSPVEGKVAMGLNFACQSVLENKGADLSSHLRDLKRMAGRVEEIAPGSGPPMLTTKLRARSSEVKTLIRHIDKWLRQGELDLNTRLDGLAWIATSLAKATLENVREQRFAELLDVLFSALPAELSFQPLQPPTKRQQKLLRQAVFTRVEDPKLSGIETKGRLGVIFSQLSRSRRFAKGRGESPPIGQGWPEHALLGDVENIAPATGEDATAIDDLITRWLRATVMGGRAWGSGFYAWPMVEGLLALLLNAAVVGWLSRLHAAGRGLDSINLEAVRAALGRVDRTSGRAVWLGSAAERMRLKYLQIDDGLRRLVSTMRHCSNS